jgi:trimeric autotransporter adhesin
VAIDSAGDIFIGDVSLDIVREVTPDGVIQTVAGTGARGDSPDGMLATSAKLDCVGDVAVNAAGDLFIAECMGHKVRRVDHLTHLLSTYAGNGAACCYSGDGGSPTGPNAKLEGPTAIVFDSSGKLLILDGYYVRQVSADGSQITTRTTLWPGPNETEYSVAVDSAGNVYTSGANNGVWRNGTVQLATGRTRSVAVGPQDEIVMAGDDSRIYGLDGQGGKAPIAGTTVGNPASGDGGPALSAAFTSLGHMTFDSTGNLYVVDYQRVRSITPYLAPDAPTSVHATLTGTSATVTWSAPTNNTGLPVAKYTMTTHSVADSNIAPVSVAGLPPATTTAVAGLAFHHQYSFTVRAWNGWLSSAESVASPTVTPLIPAGQIRTYAGGGAPPGPGQVSGPGGGATSIGQVPFALGNQGPIVYIGDLVNPVVRETFGGAEDTVAGNDAFDFSGDNAYPQSAGMRGAGAVTYCPAGNAIYMADTFNYRIRKVQNSVISTVVGTGAPGYSGDGGPATKAQIGRVFGLACGADGASLLIADSDNGAIRVLDGSGNIQTLWFGLGFPTGIAVVDANTLLVSDTGTNAVWYLIQNVGACVEAGNTFPAAYGCFPAGATSRTALAGPRGIAFDGQSLYIAEESGNRVRVVDDATGSMASFAGTGTAGFGGDGGPAISAKLNFPTSVVLSNGALYVADFANARLRQIDLTTHVITTAAGNGTLSYDGDGAEATTKILGNPDAVAVDGAGNEYVVDNYDNKVRKVDLDGQISTVAGNGFTGYTGNGGPATAATLNDPRGVAVDGLGDVFISDTANNVVRMVDHATRKISTYATGLKAPRGLAVDGAGNLYIADTGNNRVKKVEALTHVISTVAGDGVAGYSGDGGPATSARLNGPRGLAVDASGNLFISDTDNDVVRKVNGGVISTVAGIGTVAAGGDGGLAVNAGLNFPFGLAFDGSGNLLIADTGNQRIRRVGADGRIATVAGSCGQGFAGDLGLAVQAKLNFPEGLAVDGNGTVLIADSANNRVRAFRGYTSLRSVICPSPPASGGPRVAVEPRRGHAPSRHKAASRSRMVRWPPGSRSRRGSPRCESHLPFRAHTQSLAWLQTARM